MGETGTMGLCTTLTVIAFLTDSVLVLPVIGFLLVIESGSVILQLLSKKFRRKKVFLASPVHHHFEAKGWPHYKVTMRFWLAGAVLAFVLILIDLPVLPVAIGIYLPFTLVVPIFGGGIVRHITNIFIERKYGSAEEEQVSEWELAIKQTDVKPKEKIIRTGLLLTAGLIAGEALMGVIVAFLIIGGINLAIFEYPPIWPGLLLWIFIAVLLAYIPLREIFANDE